MLDAWIIDRIREDSRRREEAARIPAELPPPPPPPPQERDEAPDTGQGPVEVDFTV